MTSYYRSVLLFPRFTFLGVAQLSNPRLNSDPACIAFRSLSASRFLGFAQRLGAGVAG